MQRWIARHDVRALLELFVRRLIHPVLQRGPDGVLHFESALERSAGTRLREAIDANDLVALELLFAEGTVNLEDYLPGDGTTRPLMHAVAQGHIEMVERLVAAGADPDGGTLGDLRRPAFQALLDGDTTILRILAEAGADLGTSVYGGGRLTSMIGYALASDSYALVELLIELGANPDVADSAGWTPLMDALQAERLPYVKLLLPISDPRIDSGEPIPRGHRYKSLERRWFPRTNALHLAGLLSSDARAELVAAVRARAHEIDPEAGERLAVMRARRSESDLAWFEGRAREAIEAHREAIAIAEVPAFDALTNGDLIVQGMEMLTELHEMLVIEGETFDEGERAAVEHIVSLGGWQGKLHAMLDAVAAGREAYPSATLQAWSTAYGQPSREDWDYRRLNAWIESIEDASVRDRLFDTLDFFELN